MPTPGGSPKWVRVPYNLKGYGNYELLNQVEEFKYIKDNLQVGENVWRPILHYEYLDPVQGFKEGTLNFYRLWVYYHSVVDNDEFYIVPPGGYTYDYDQYSQPWMYVDTTNSKHRYDMYQSQNCLQVPGRPENCYYWRLDYMLLQALQYGVILQFDYFDRAWAESNYSINPWFKDNQLPEQQNEISQFMGQYYFTNEMSYARNADMNYPNTRLQQNKLVRMFTVHCAPYPNVFYMVMNEPEVDWRESYEVEQGKYVNRAAEWHKAIAEHAHTWWENSQFGHSGVFLMGLNIYSSVSVGCGDDAHRENKKALRAFIKGNPKASPGGYGALYGELETDRFQIISYHTPYYKNADEYGNCICENDQIQAVKNWHYNVDQFPWKACLIDTDGDGQYGCRENVSWLHTWADHAYSRSSGNPNTIYADFISKMIYKQMPMSYLPTEPEKQLMNAIEEAWQDHN